MASEERNENLGFSAAYTQNCIKTPIKCLDMADTITTRQGTFEIRSEAHGPHWVAWLARTSDGTPEQAVLLVGQTQSEAEARARQWGEQL
jgi:hypothetical protein